MTILQGIAPPLEKRDLEQLQHVLNLEEEEQTYLSSNRQNNPVGNPRIVPLNL